MRFSWLVVSPGHDSFVASFQCATRRSAACRCKCDWKSVDPTHSIPSLGLMAVTTWVKRRQGSAGRKTEGCSDRAPVMRTCGVAEGVEKPEGTICMAGTQRRGVKFITICGILYLQSPEVPLRGIRMKLSIDHSRKRPRF